MRTLIILSLFIIALASCRPTKKIQTAINKKDTTAVVSINNHAAEDSLKYISETLQGIRANHIDFQTFNAKVNVDYVDADDRNYNVNANLRMYKDSVIWVSVNAIFGIEALRALITKDSVKILDKQHKVYTARSIKYLQEVSALPLDLSSLQDLLIGNPVFIDSVVTYANDNAVISLLSIGSAFKNLVTINASNNTLIHSKLDDVDITRSRTADLGYDDYETKKGKLFSTKRRISIAEKNKLDISLNFKQVEFNEEVNFPFSIPKNYKRK